MNQKTIYKDVMNEIDSFDCINWCPECGEPREVCESLKQCPIWRTPPMTNPNEPPDIATKGEIMNDKNIFQEYQTLGIHLVLLQTAKVLLKTDKPSDYVANLWEEIGILIQELTKQRKELFERFITIIDGV